MTELWENPMFRNKIQKLPPHLRERFIETMKEMYDQESDGMISFLGESRNEMLATADEISEEQEQLRIESETIARGKLTSRDSARDPERAFSPSDSVFAEAVGTYLERRASLRPTSASSLMYESISQRGSPVPPPVKEEKPKKKRKNKENISQNAKDEKELEAATQEILANMSGYDSKLDSERDRQRERVEMMKQKIKEKKKARENMAQELLDIAQEIETSRKKDKEKQGQRLKERLEEKKKQKGGGS